LRHGQRAFVGRVAMDHPLGTPEWFRDSSASAAVAASHASIDAIAALPDNAGLVRPIITPRFIPACSDALLAGLGELATATGELVQTHCSESDWEHQYVLDRFGMTDAARLAEFGLARDHSVLAHCCHVTDVDLGLLVETGAGVAHCPLSNVYFGDAVFPARAALERGVRVGLGTDIAGGSGVGLLHQSAMAVSVSRMREDGVDPGLVRSNRGVVGSRLDVIAAFWLATCGGAGVLGIPVGLIEAGRHFDAFVVDTERSGSGLRNWAEVDTAERLFEKIVRLAGAADITHVWVGGRRVVG
jgi:guanine deaminase